MSRRKKNIHKKENAAGFQACELPRAVKNRESESGVVKARDVAQLGECLTRMHKVLD